MISLYSGDCCISRNKITFAGNVWEFFREGFCFMTKLICEWCNDSNKIASKEINPWCDSQVFAFCEECYENAYDNARERQGSDYNEEELE